MQYRSHNAVSLLLLILAALVTPATGLAMTLSGRVTDLAGKPVPGASVVVLDSGKAINGVACDSAGVFELRLHVDDRSQFVLRFSSVGFATCEETIEQLEHTDSLLITLTPVTTDVGGITVTPPPSLATSEEISNTAEIQKEARRSLIPTNPTASLKQPQITRAGTSHSSQIRVHGTNPNYYLNGLAIGSDPNHYGMFSIIPSSVVRQVKFYPLGTSAQYRLPSVIEFLSPTPFGGRKGGNVYLSSIDVTGTVTAAGDNSYTLVAYRHSVLDRLIGSLNVNSDRRTIPPTNFQDIYGTAGLRLSEHLRLMLDQYDVRDNLSFNTASATHTETGVNTAQITRQNYAAVHLQALYDDLLVKATIAGRTEHRIYSAVPDEKDNSDRLMVDIEESRRAMSGSIGMELSMDRSTLQAGIQMDHDFWRRLDMSQHNWNFLSPFANSDNPDILQPALNSLYSDVSNDVTGTDWGGYVAAIIPGERFSLETGVRTDRYTRLRDPDHFSYRTRLTYLFKECGSLELFHGTFSQSPLDNILEPYQALTRADLFNLDPIKTNLWSLGLACGRIRASLFHKRVSGFPVLTPDFTKVSAEDTSLDPGFVTMRSSGQLRFRGGTLSYEREPFIWKNVSLFASYAYTQATRTVNGVNTSYELNAPHKFLSQVDWDASRTLSLGAEIQIRSGYPYSPLRSDYPSVLSPDAAETYYYRELGKENTLQFPAHAYLTINAEYRFSHVDLFASVANVTNRANPIISSGSGLIYDAGIMPMVGLQYRF